MGDQHDHLIRALAADLRPVVPLSSPLVRTAFWFAASLVLALLLYALPTRPHLGQVGGDASPTVFAGVAASVFLAFFAALAAFELSLPQRGSWWALLSLPFLAAFILIQGWGCLESLYDASVWGASIEESSSCLVATILLSLPPSALILFMLRKTMPLRPHLVAVQAGLAGAGVGAFLLILVHPHDSALLDLAAHMLAIAIIIAANLVLGGWLLSPKKFAPIS
jgi:hypothetical protein